MKRFIVNYLKDSLILIAAVSLISFSSEARQIPPSIPINYSPLHFPCLISLLDPIPNHIDAKTDSQDRDTWKKDKSRIGNKYGLRFSD